MGLFTYKLTHDTGFAPNPFHGYLTLATCKPGIRRTKSVGDWIAGFTSKALVQSSGGTAQPWDGTPRLVYLMKVTERLSIAEYYADKRFAAKIPQLKGSSEKRAGDNIYKPLRAAASSPSEFGIIDNPNHPAADDHIARDLSGINVLVSDEFFYFGRDALKLLDDIGVSVPGGPSLYGQRVDDASAERLIRFITKKYKIGVHAHPHIWTESKVIGSCKPSMSSGCVR